MPSDVSQNTVKINQKQHLISVYISFYVIYLLCTPADHVAFTKEVHMPRKSKTVSGTGLGVRIGRNIKIARTRLGITQSQLAEAIDLENVSVSRIETGAQLPSLDRLDVIAKVLKVSLTTLLADTSKSTAFAELLAEVMNDLPAREKEFLYGFAVTYAQHWKAGKKK